MPGADRPVVVIGGGVGGLAVAIRLAARGRDVTVVERRGEWGGKLTVHSREGYTFDAGPSLVLLPHLLDEVLALAGTSLAAVADMRRLDPQFRYHWPGGSSLQMHDDDRTTMAAIDGLAPGAGREWHRFVERGRRIWDTSERTFLAGPMENPARLVRRMRSPLDLVRIDPVRTLHASARRAFGDPRLWQWAGRYATYSGSSPFAAPATLGCIPHIERHYGCWYPMGGLGVLRDALVDAASRIGVVLKAGEAVDRIETGGSGAVSGVRLAGGDRLPARVVVADVDARALYEDLLPTPPAAARARRAPPSTSGFVVMAGVRGTTPGVGHHNVWFSPDDRAEFRDLTAGRLHGTPTVYGCVSALTDPSQAPPGCENWFLLVNVPAGSRPDPERYTTVVLERLSTYGSDIAARMSFADVLGPADLAERYASPGGAIYGTSSDGMGAAFRRPANRGARRGLYLVGGSSHPGGGLPLVLTGARIVDAMIDADGA